MLEYPTPNARPGETVRDRVNRLLATATIDQQLQEAYELLHHAIGYNSEDTEQSCYDYDLMELSQELIANVRDEHDFHSQYQKTILTHIKEYIIACATNEKPKDMIGALQLIEHLLAK